MIKNEGILSPYRGIGAVLMGTGPAHALYFSTYEYAKLNLPKISILFNDTKLQYGNIINLNNLFKGVSGICATLVHDLCLNPVEGIFITFFLIFKSYKTKITNG